QVPAFLISLAAGLLVTRSSSPVNLPMQFVSQLTSRGVVLAVAAGFLVLLMFTGLPALPLAAIGGICALLAFAHTRRGRAPRSETGSPTAAQAKPAPPPRVEDYLAVEAMEIEVGVALIRLADSKRGGDLVDRIARVRQMLASDMGLIMPKVRIRDNMRL